MNRFCNLISSVRDLSLGVPIPAELLEVALDHLYSSPERVYHNKDHIFSGLLEIDSARQLLECPDELELAWYFHDSVYRTNKSDNEEKSADLAAGLLNMSGVDPKKLETVKQLILDTKHLSYPRTTDGKFIVDVDLSIFGKSESVYDAYSRGIRKEYSWVCEEDYQKKRVHVLEGFLNRFSIYSTDFFKERYEEQARKNLQREIKSLRQ